MSYVAARSASRQVLFAGPFLGSLVFRTLYCDSGADGKLPLADDAHAVPRRYADVISRLNDLEGVTGFETSLRKSGMKITDEPWPV